MKTEFKGTILAVRDVEDCIRATRRYTKGAFSRSVPHPQGPIQGGDFASRLITEYYEVYPEMDLSWDMSASRAWEWVWGDTTHIDVRFIYDYRQDTAKVIIFGGSRALAELSRGIPGLNNKLKVVIEACEVKQGVTGAQPIQAKQENEIVDQGNRIDANTITHTIKP